MVNLLKTKIKSTSTINNIPRVIHCIYLNEIPHEYIFGGQDLVGLKGLCDKAQKEDYQVNLWVPEPKDYYDQILKTNKTLDALVDPHTEFLFPNLKVRKLSDLYSEMDENFNECNTFDSHFSDDLKKFIHSETVNNFNLAAASNLWRLVILALYGGIYCDISKTFQKRIDPNSFTYDTLLKQVQFGFSRIRCTNFLLVSQPQHMVILETLQFIIQNYRYIYDVSYKNLTKNKQNPTEVWLLKEQVKTDGPINFFKDSDPVSYTRSRDKKYREASTELLNGIYPFNYGLIKYFETLFCNYFSDNTLLNLHTIFHEERIDCLHDGVVSDYRSNQENSSRGIFNKLNDSTRAFIPLHQDFSLPDSTYPLAQYKEQPPSNQKNWRELVEKKKLRHTSDSIYHLFNGCKIKPQTHDTKNQKTTETYERKNKI